MESTCQAPHPKHGRQILPLDLICIDTCQHLLDPLSRCRCPSGVSLMPKPISSFVVALYSMMLAILA
jgi:hypothetical protein